jgi:hypothetical protein
MDVSRTRMRVVGSDRSDRRAGRRRLRQVGGKLSFLINGSLIHSQHTAQQRTCRHHATAASHNIRHVLHAERLLANKELATKGQIL